MYNFNKTPVRFFSPLWAFNPDNTSDRFPFNSYQLYKTLFSLFGPPQFKETHDQLANEFFDQFFNKRIFVGQLRTRLGMTSMETEGPEKAVRNLLDLIRD